MKNLIQYTLINFFCMFLFSCSNDFLLEQPEASSLVIEAEILILPEWGIVTRSIHVPGAGNAKFRIINTPDWFHVTTSSGQFQDDIAVINCIASRNSSFFDVGVYSAFMLLEIEGRGKHSIPIAYITEGNPVIETERNLTLPFYYSDYNSFTTYISNNGEGILLWGIAEKPDWITVKAIDEILPEQTLSPLSLYGGVGLELIYNNAESLASGNLNGKIVIVSNDKNNSEIVINLEGSRGDFYCDTHQLNFGRSEDTQTILFTNRRYGSALTWTIESLPEWLSVSKPSGFLISSTSRLIIFTLDRNRLPVNGIISHTIYLKTNDIKNPLHAITVTVNNE
jgi:hypothetical protein